MGSEISQTQQNQENFIISKVTCYTYLLKTKITTLPVRLYYRFGSFNIVSIDDISQTVHQYPVTAFGFLVVLLEQAL